MAKFNAGTAVEAIEFDFTAFGGRAGSIPEPSTDQVENFMAAITGLFAQYKGIIDVAQGKEPTADEIAAMVEDFGDITSRDVQQAIADAIEQFSSGEPTAAEVMALPHRIQSAFLGFLLGEVNPEARAATTK